MTATIQSGWCAQSLTLTGVLDATRWSGAGSMEISNLGMVLLQNDAQFLYVGLDVVKDVANDPGTGDYFWLSFDVDKNKTISRNVDVDYGVYQGQPNHIGKSFYQGPGRWSVLLPTPAECRIGFGASFKSAVPHRMWEIKIPLADIGGALNHSSAHVFMGLRVVSKTPAMSIEVPPGFPETFSALIRVVLTQSSSALLIHLLEANPLVAAAMQWQVSAGSLVGAYAPPRPENMVAFYHWSPRQMADLAWAFEAALRWKQQGAPSVQSTCDGLTDAPMNVFPTIRSDLTVKQSVTSDYMWKLYVNHVAFSLAHMATGGFSLANLAADQLRWLLNSATMAWKIRGRYYGMGTYRAFVPALRANNRPSTSFAPPRWVYSWLRDNQLIGQTRKDTICRLLDWMRHNLVHFYGKDTFGTCQAVWQYLGYPPLSRIVSGTIDTNLPAYGKQCYTMGCHGSVGFLNAVLRVVNIPVVPVWICGHELAYFPTEGLYLDHGDDPYTLNVRTSSKPISLLLIDEVTYAARFSQNPTENVIGDSSAACSNVGKAADTFPQ